MRNQLVLLFSILLACPVILAAQGLNTAAIDQVLGTPENVSAGIKAALGKIAVK